MIPLVIAFWLGHNVGRGIAKGRLTPVYLVLGPFAEGSFLPGG